MLSEGYHGQLIDINYVLCLLAIFTILFRPLSVRVVTAVSPSVEAGSLFPASMFLPLIIVIVVSTPLRSKSESDWVSFPFAVASR